ncbi:hypothetical protein QFZ80_007470 [Paenibacillus sp. V4I7]|nr:hypothetical protein [Paenibacillus sp. V4I7]
MEKNDFQTKNNSPQLSCAELNEMIGKKLDREIRNESEVLYPVYFIQ